MPESTPRNTTRQREAGAASRLETRRRLLEAAAQEFDENGYQAATVVRIARRAGVTVQTLYLAWGSKRALLRGYMERALAGQDDASYAEVLPSFIDAGLADDQGDAAVILAQISHLYRGTAERAASAWKLYRDAAAVDAQVAEDWQALQHLRRQTFAGLIERVPLTSLRSGLTREQAAEAAWVIASPETYELFVRTAGHSIDEYEQWVATTLVAALLQRNEPAGRRPGHKDHIALE